MTERGFQSILIAVRYNLQHVHTSYDKEEEETEIFYIVEN